MTTALYDTDFYQWTVKQAELLRNEDYAELDLDHLIEEIESMGKNDRRDVASRLTTIMEHMLKLVCEPHSRAVRAWSHTILVQRDELNQLLEDNATLRAQIDDFIQTAYQRARRRAASVTKCSLSQFPEICPWTSEQILDLDWLPG